MNVGSRTVVLCLSLALLALVASTARVPAQDVTEVRLKAAFVYNFAKFTEWPDNTLGPLTTANACVRGDTAVAQALTDAVRDRSLHGRPIAVQIDPPDAALPSCHLLYVSGADASATGVLGSLRNAPVLTISDEDGFAEGGGIIQLRVESARMRFSINTRAAICAGLSLSARMLALAEIVEGRRLPVGPDARSGGTVPVAAAGAPPCGPETREP